MSRQLPRPIGLLLAVVALVSQLALGAVVAEDVSPAALLALDDVSLLCSGAAPDQAPAHRHQSADFSLCPLSVALALPAVVPVPAPVFPAPRAVLVVRQDERPPGRGPPPRTARVGAPRAPPFIA